MLISSLIPLSVLPIALSFRITVPGTVKVNSSSTAEWKRTEGDPSTFGFLLRRTDQTKGGDLIAVVSSSDSAGQITFTAKEETHYLIRIVSDTSPLGPNDQPKQIFTTSNGFAAVSDSDRPSSSTSTIITKNGKAQVSTFPSPPITQTSDATNLPPTTNTMPNTTSTQRQSQTPGISGSGPTSVASTVGRIAGPVVGVVALIILVTVGLILRRRGKRSLHPTKSAEVLPYPNTTSASNVAPEKKRQLEWLDQNVDAARVSTEAENPNREDVSSSIAGSHAQQDTDVNPPMRTRRVVYHDDSGWRPSAPRSDAGNSSVLEMPPRYDAAM